MLSVDGATRQQLVFHDLPAPIFGEFESRSCLLLKREL
jgi:hypothetical protein